MKDETPSRISHNAEIAAGRDSTISRGVSKQTQIYVDRAAGPEVWDVEGDPDFTNAIRFLAPLTFPDDVFAEALDILETSIDAKKGA